MSLYHAAQLRLRRGHVVGRRDFLKVASAAGLASGSLGFAGGSLAWTSPLAAHAAELKKRHKACILLWMQGGPSQLDTFDPKPGHANGGETKVIDTAISGVKISENFPEIAKIMDRTALVRSLTTKEGNHPRATYLMHTSYVPTATVRHPTLGSVVAKELPNPECELPAFVRIGGRGLGGGGNGGLLGTAFDPFEIQQASTGPANSTPTTPVDRYQRRLGLLGKLETAAAVPALAQPTADHRSLYEAASKMILSPQMKTFDLSQESDKAKAAYGSGDFANGCLLARRLVEAGVPCVEVSLGNWDTHFDNFDKVRELSGQVDRPMAALIRDLEERGLLDDTLVIWMGEFGRTPRINPRGGRDHFPRAFSAVMAGGGVKGGQVIGRTDAGGEEVADRPITEKDLLRSIYKSLGIKADKENMSSIGRPIKLVDGGTAVDELFA